MTLDYGSLTLLKATMHYVCDSLKPLCESSQGFILNTIKFPEDFFNWSSGGINLQIKIFVKPPSPQTVTYIQGVANFLLKDMQLVLFSG